MFFHKKDKEEEVEKPAKKVYDFENDKNKKINVSALYESLNGNHVEEKQSQPEEKTSSKSPIIAEFEINLEDSVEKTEGDIEEDDSDEVINTDEEPEDDDLNYFDDEREKVDIKKILKVLSGTAIGIFAIVCVWVSNSHLFLISKVGIKDRVLIEISGDEENIIIYDDSNTNVFDSQINELSKKYMDVNIFLANTTALKKEIENLPAIYTVKVNRKLPDTLEIDYTLREQYVNIFNNDRYLMLDKYGHVIDESSEQNVYVPFVKGISDRLYKVGNVLNDTDLVKFKNISYLIETAANIDFGYTILEINYEKTEDVYIKLAESPIYIDYGAIDKNVMSDKLIYLQEIIKKSIANGYRGTLDISAEDYLSKSVLNSEI